MPLERLASLRQLLHAAYPLHARPFASTVMAPQPTAPRGWLRPRPASFALRPCSRRLAHRIRTPPTKAILPRPATDGKKKFSQIKNNFCAGSTLEAHWISADSTLDPCWKRSKNKADRRWIPRVAQQGAQPPPSNAWEFGAPRPFDRPRQPCRPRNATPSAGSFTSNGNRRGEAKKDSRRRDLVRVLGGKRPSMRDASRKTPKFPSYESQVPRL